MEQLEMVTEEIDTRLSHSSANTLRGCSRKYYHYKIAKTKPDSDYNPNMASLAVGKTFHQVLEDHMHEKPKKIVNEIQEACKNNNCEEENIPMIHAMLLKYYEGHKSSGLKVIKCEYQIDTEVVNGFIDVIMEDSKGGWWICDLKTYKSDWFVKKANLTMDYQLNLYAAHVDLIAKDLGLEEVKFKGCKMLIVTKPSLKQRKDESYVEYVTRLKGSTKYLPKTIPKRFMSPSEIYNSHKRLQEKTLEMRKWDDKGECNFNNCFAYNSPCQFYSQCHEGTFTELEESLELE